MVRRGGGGRRAVGRRRGRGGVPLPLPPFQARIWELGFGELAPALGNWSSARVGGAYLRSTRPSAASSSSSSASASAAAAASEGDGSGRGRRDGSTCEGGRDSGVSESVY